MGNPFAWIVLLVILSGFIRNVRFLKRDRKQKEEIIRLLGEIQRSLQQQ